MGDLRFRAPQWLIRADSGGSHGSGHVMRMIALAQAIQERGGRVALAHGECPPALARRLAEEDIQAFAVGDGVSGSVEDVRETVALARTLGCEGVVLDGYKFKDDFQGALRRAGCKVLCLDDFGHCTSWAAEWVLNQNLSADDEAARYTRVAAESKVLLGPRYALLRREFRDWGRGVSDSAKRAWPGKILITFGGVDPEGATLRVLRALDGIAVADLQLVVLVGPANLRAEEIITAAKKSSHAVEILRDVRDMPALYAAVDGVISAGGSSCYEWLYFRLPAWVTSIADNQDGIVEALYKKRLAAGVARLASASDTELVASLAVWMARSTVRPPAALIDGLGAVRVAAWLFEFPYFVRTVDPQTDAIFLYDLANDPTVRAAGLHPEPIKWDPHVVWLNAQAANPDTRLFVFESVQEGPVGQVRFHRHPGDIWEIGVSIRESHRGRGLAVAAVELGQQAMRKQAVSRWRARVRPENVRSGRLFERLGFEKVGSEPQILMYERIESAK